MKSVQIRFWRKYFDIIIKVKLANIAILSDSNNSPLGKLILLYSLKYISLHGNIKVDRVLFEATTVCPAKNTNTSYIAL